MVSDPLGGLFAFERHVVEDVAIGPDAGRFLLEVLVRGRWSLVAEIPYVLADRAAGRSKAGPGEGWPLALQVARLRRAATAAPAVVPAAMAVAVP